MASTRRGVTLTEVLVGMSMTVVLTVAAADLYGYVMRRMAADLTQNAVVSQAYALSDDLSKTIGESTSCTLVSSGGQQGLRCVMPASGVDSNGDAVLDTGYPSSTPGEGVEVFNSGLYVWIYPSDSTGSWGASGNFLWRAKVNGSSNPLSGDVDSAWSTYYGSGTRWATVDSVTFSVDPVGKTTTFTIIASSLNRAERSAVGDPSNSDNSRVAITRTVTWRNSR